MTKQPTTTDRQTLSAHRPAAPCPTQSGLPACSKAVPPGKGRRLRLLPALVLMLLISSGRPALAAAPSSSAPVLIGPMHLLLRNNPPVPTLLSFTMAEDTIHNGTLTATDQEGNPLSYAKAGESGHGTLSVNADGGFTYTPTTNYFGADSFTYSVSDGVHTVNQMVAITVTDVAEAADNPPTGEDKTVDAGDTNTGSTTLNLVDPDGTPVTANVTGSGILAGDIIISSATIIGNTATIVVSSGTGSGYIDYQVTSNGLTNPTTYRVTFNYLNGF